jgi:transposase
LGSGVPRNPSYEQLATLVVQQAAVIESLQTRVASLEVEVVALRRQAGRDSSNSSLPPSQDGPASKAKAEADKRSAGQGPGDGQDPQDGQDPKYRQQDPKDGQPGGEQRPKAEREGHKRAQGGQRGHRGTGLERAAHPDRTEPVEPPACDGCGGDLTGAPGRIASSVQVFDIPTFSLAVTEYLMMCRDCGCGRSTTADLPPGVRGGPTCFGPQVVATLLASQDVIGIERTADLMSALLGVEVSTGFISSCLARLDAALTGPAVCVRIATS